MNDLTEQMIGEEEGRNRHAYLDTLKFVTIGIGCCVDSKVPGAGLCDAAIDAQFAHDVATANSVCARIPGFSLLEPVQQAALRSVAFQLGDQILGWKHFMGAMDQHPPDVEAAGNALLDSHWAKTETPRRALREVLMLKYGQWVERKLEMADLLSWRPSLPTPNPPPEPPA